MNYFYLWALMFVSITVINQAPSQCQEIITLNCSIGKNVLGCWWTKNGGLVTVAGRYQYIAGKKQSHTNDCSNQITSTNDCSIQIKSINAAKDDGIWTCLYREFVHSDQSEYTVISVIQGAIFKPLQLLDMTATKQPPHYGTPTLPCRLRLKRSTCYWKVNDRKVIINHRFKNLGDGQTQTTDCSIKITNFEPALHQGYWTCHYKDKDDIDHLQGIPLKVDHHGYLIKLNGAEIIMLLAYYRSDAVGSKHFLVFSTIIISSMLINLGQYFRNKFFL